MGVPNNLTLIPIVARWDRVCKEEYEKIIDNDINNRDYIELDSVKKPTRATPGSAGYDFYTPIDIVLNPGEEIIVSTFIKAYIVEGWCLIVMPKSGIGSKYYARIANTIGLIDQDYAYSDNDGNILVKLRNEGDKVLTINKGDKFCQGLFIPFGIVTGDDEDTKSVRHGGHGSTGK